MDGFIGQGKDVVARLRVLLGGMATGEETVVGVEGGVKKVEAIKLFENFGVEQQRCCLRIAGMRSVEALESIHCARKIEIVEVQVGLDNEGVSVQRVRMDARAPG